ncbi:MAG TPA: DUF3368 domain-containing protein [Anaerolineae bacterium]
MTNWLLDTTVLSNFAHVQRPELLRLLFGQSVATTPTVMSEVHEGEALGLIPLQEWSWLPLIAPTDSERQLALGYEKQLDPGEAECLAIALTRDYGFLSDDFAARRMASQVGVTLSGTLGVLQKLVATAHITIPEADQLLAIMISQGYRSPVQSLAELKGGI